jgi:hypothetical protein
MDSTSLMTHLPPGLRLLQHGRTLTIRYVHYLDFCTFVGPLCDAVDLIYFSFSLGMNQILNAYAAHPPQPTQQYMPQQGGPAPMPGNQPTFNGGPMPNAGAIEEKPLSELEKAMKKLVNIERIDEPAEKEYVLTLKKKEEEQRKAKDGKSKPKPPAAVGLVGSSATLDHIKTVKPVSEIQIGLL